MGMDCYIYEARNREVFKSDDWYNADQVVERMYWRKNWDHVNNLSFVPDDYDGEFIELTVDNLNEWIRVACDYRDYWGKYDTVPKLCELRDQLIEWEENDDPRKLFMEYNW